MTSTIIYNARILTLAGEPEVRRGRALRELGVIERGFMWIEDGRIAAVGEGDPPDAESSTHPPAPSLRGGGGNADVINAGGRVLMPAFVDCHTHACWAGDRFDEFALKLGGASYLEILKAGGGIMSTVRAVRSASQEQLTELLLMRLQRMAALGSASVEVKSGYGLTTDAELKILRAIRDAAVQSPLQIVSTFLGAHALDPENPHCVDQIIAETLPIVASEFPGIVCDAYCETGAWSLMDCRRYFEKARALGCPIRVHSDQFNSLGMTRLAIELGAISVDHLEAVTPHDLEHLARSSTIGVALPCSGFHLDDRYAPARELVDAGGALAIATNYNPGSAPTPSMPFVMSLACRKLKLLPEEAIVAATFNAACVLNMQLETGSIEVGKRADLQLLDTTDERELGFEIARPGPRMLWAAGELFQADKNSPQRHRGHREEL